MITCPSEKEEGGVWERREVMIELNRLTILLCTMYIQWFYEIGAVFSNKHQRILQFMLERFSLVMNAHTFNIICTIRNTYVSYALHVVT